MCYCPLIITFLYCLLRNSTCWWTYLAFLICGLFGLVEFSIGMSRCVGRLMNTVGQRHGGILVHFIRTLDRTPDEDSPFDYEFFTTSPSAKWMRHLPYYVGLSSNALPAPDPDMDEWLKAKREHREKNKPDMVYTTKKMYSSNRQCERIGYCGACLEWLLAVRSLIGLSAGLQSWRSHHS